jgi:hypothetical protein
MAHLTGGMAYPQPTSVVVGSSAPPIALGTRARDASGGEYVYVDFQSAFIIGEIASFNSSFQAAKVTTATIGPVGMVVATATSDSVGWLQIYGYTSVLQGTSLLVAGPVGLDATTLGYSMPITLTTSLIALQGVYVVTGSTVSSLDPTSTVGTSLGGAVTAVLNYPFVDGGSPSS